MKHWIFRNYGWIAVVAVSQEVLARLLTLLRWNLPGDEQEASDLDARDQPVDDHQIIVCKFRDEQIPHVIQAEAALEDQMDDKTYREKGGPPTYTSQT